MDTVYIKRKIDNLDKTFENHIKKQKNNIYEVKTDVNIINWISEHYKKKIYEQEDYGHYIQTDFLNYQNNQRNQICETNQSDSDFELINFNFRTNKRF